EVRSGGAGKSERGLPRLGPGESADVGLWLEGTYPYVSGGVSSWVHEIITGLPELTFGAIFLGASPETYGDIRCELPPNLVHLETHYLMSGPRPAAVRRERRGGEPSTAVSPSGA